MAITPNGWKASQFWKGMNKERQTGVECRVRCDIPGRMYLLICLAWCSRLLGFCFLFVWLLDRRQTILLLLLIGCLNLDRIRRPSYPL